MAHELRFCHDGTLTVDVEPLTPGTVYDFEVRASELGGPGKSRKHRWTLMRRTLRTPTATAPTAVPRLRTTLGTHAGTVLGHQSSAAITVSWDALGPTVNGGAAITGYELCYKKSTGSAWMRWDGTGFSNPAAVGGGGALWSAVHGADQGLLDPGTTYEYRARALNSVATAGSAVTCTHWDGAWSNVASATTPVVAPAAPVLAAVGRRDQRMGSQRQLDHDQVDGANDDRRRRDHQLRSLGGH